MKIYGVSEYLAFLNTTLEEDAVIEGEVSGFSVSNQKWIFFSLKDENGSVLECFSMVFWVKTPIADGMRVRVLGNPKVYEKSGRLRFIARDILPVGEGSLKRAYMMLKKKLQEEGLFAPERKRKLPRFPQKIVLITSKDSAAFGDFMKIYKARWGASQIELISVKVQGEGAVEEILTAFAQINTKSAGGTPDAVVLIRGGGSLEDLSAFNDERVARAIYGCRFPVVVGVGHERDESLADFIADVRASTPSNAAELSFPDKREVINELNFSIEHWHNILFGRFEKIIEIFFAVPNTILEKIYFMKEDVKNQERFLLTLNPRSLLKKGYSIVRTGTRVIKSIKRVKAGKMLSIEVADGNIGAEVV